MNRLTDSVRIALFDPTDNSRFLVLAETDEPDNWKLAGGKFNTVDETPDEAAARELEEELHMTAHTVQLAKAGELINNDGISARHIYAGTAAESDIKPSSEIAHIRWVTQDTIPEGPNKSHILSAVLLARSALNN